MCAFWEVTNIQSYPLPPMCPPTPSSQLWLWPSLPLPRDGSHTGGCALPSHPVVAYRLVLSILLLMRKVLAPRTPPYWSRTFIWARSRVPEKNVLVLTAPTFPFPGFALTMSISPARSPAATQTWGLVKANEGQVASPPGGHCHPEPCPRAPMLASSCRRDIIRNVNY